jgi:hypothetical protein
MTDVLDDIFAGLDLDAAAAKREQRFPGGLPIPFRGEVYTLPSELPGDILDPLLDLDINLADVMVQAGKLIRDQGATDEAAQAAGINILTQALTANPTLPFDLVRAARGCLQALFDYDPDNPQWDRFLAARPTLPDYAVLIRGLFRAYGVSLGEASGSRTPSAPDGATPSATSGGTNGSTRGGRGRVPADRKAKAVSSG